MYSCVCYVAVPRDCLISLFWSCCVVGQYCILKKRDCPVNFRDGFIYWDDAAPWFGGKDTRQSSKGLFCLVTFVFLLVTVK